PSKASKDWRRIALVAVLTAGIATFLWSTSQHYPVSRWLFWRYAAYVLVGAGWALSVWSAGALVHRRLDPAQLPALERFTIELGRGFYLFFLAMFVAGLTGFFNAALALLLPAVLITAGASKASARWKRARRFFLAAAPRTTGARAIALAIGVGVG